MTGIEVYEQPPKVVYERAQKQFGVDWNDGVIFTYGDKIYTKHKLSDDLVVHENTHVKQQNEIGVDVWWDRYFEEVEFRLSQEVEAYHNQYEYYRKVHKDRNKVFKFLHEIAVILSSPMYGADVGRYRAIEMIKTGKIIN